MDEIVLVLHVPAGLFVWVQFRLVYMSFTQRVPCRWIRDEQEVNRCSFHEQTWRLEERSGRFRWPVGVKPRPCNGPHYITQVFLIKWSVCEQYVSTLEALKIYRRSNSSFNNWRKPHILLLKREVNLLYTSSIFTVFKFKFMISS